MFRSVNLCLLAAMMVLAIAPCGSLEASNLLEPVAITVRGLDADGNVDDVVVVQYLMDNKVILYGWSFGVCNDSLVELNPGSVINGVDTATINGGFLPEFQSIQEFAGGFTVGAVTNFSQTSFLPEGTDQHLYSADYTLLGAGLAHIEFCSTLGSPPVALLAAGEDTEYTPATVDETILIYDPNPAYLMSASDAAGDVDGTASVGVLFTFPTAALHGWSFGVCHDELVSLGAGDVTNSATTATVNAGSPPEFQSVLYYAEGFTVGAVVDFDGVEGLAPGVAIEVYSVEYSLLAVGTSVISFCDDLGLVPVEHLMVTDSGEFTPVTSDGSIEITEPAGTLFKRGDINNDGNTNALVDALFLLSWQFSGGAEPSCRDAADVNGDNVVNALVDALYLLTYQFSSGAAPPAPGPAICGLDPDDDAAVTCLTPAPACNP